jgi:hypothetical protein
MTQSASYPKIVQTLKRRQKGATVADICSATALPLEEVRTLLPKAADEFSGRLQVTESGEIMYSFPDGFKSRYRGFFNVFKRGFSKFLSVFKKILVVLFKIWIMVMLIGYFVLFILIIIGVFVLTIAAQSKSSSGRSSSRGGGLFSPNFFSLLWQIWFIQEFSRPYDYAPAVKKEKNTRPMHKAIYSFVFGEEDPNKDWQEKENKAIISYIQSNRGVISLAEYMAFTGKNSLEAEEAILKFCCSYGGSPEATDEGTIVYRFNDLLLKSDAKTFAELSPPVKRLKIFSANKKSLNITLILINAVNLLFGSYFLYNASVHGFLQTDQQYIGAGYVYSILHIVMEAFTHNPVLIISVVLGIIPLVFSILFWLIPLIRKIIEKKENENTKLQNFKKLNFTRIWSKPKKVDASQLESPIEECKPKNLPEAQDRVIKDLGAIANPDIEQDENGKPIYSFNELEREKQALAKYRQSMDLTRTDLGNTVFDTSKP